MSGSARHFGTPGSSVILEVSQLLSDWGGRIRGLDINPLVVFPEGVKVVDALIVKEQG
jgi:hypothetical protein